MIPKSREVVNFTGRVEMPDIKSPVVTDELEKHVEWAGLDLGCLH
jgi:hypothetical protein